MEPKHAFTPGPWLLAESCTVGQTADGKWFHRAEIVTHDHATNQQPYIAEVWPRAYRETEEEALYPDPECAANAVLIAAPTLFAFAEKVAESFEGTDVLLGILAHDVIERATA